MVWWPHYAIKHFIPGSLECGIHRPATSTEITAVPLPVEAS